MSVDNASLFESIFNNSDSMSNMLSNFSSLPVSNIGSIILVVLEMIILMRVHVPMYGLRFVPVYGEYFFYSKLLPDKKKLCLAFVLTQVIYMIIFIPVLIYLFFVALLDMWSGKGITSGLLGVFMVVFIILGIIGFVLKLLINLDLERFGFNRYLGIVFALIDLVRVICCIVKSDDFITAVQRDDGSYMLVNNKLYQESSDYEEYDDSYDEEY